MTFVGKILVIVIMVFALFFLALSTVVFTTSVDWKSEVTKLNDAKKKVTDEKNRLENNLKDAAAKFEVAQNEAQKAEVDFKAKIKSLTEQNSQAQTEITEQRKSVEVALEQVKAAQDEAEARIGESNVLRDNLKTVQDQRDAYLLQKTDLNQRIIILERELQVAQNNNKDLRDRVAVLSGALNKAGLSSDVVTYQGLLAPPDDVEGVVTRVDASNQIVEISIGKDDGLVVGHELVLFRTKPSPEYLGKVKIISVDPDRASARVIGKTYLGKKIQENDSVATKIRPRS
jgi:hypothetical protein